jgi:hypothetical protein
MLDQSTTLATIVKNQAEASKYFLKKASRYAKRHLNIKRIIIYDNQSKDDTIEVIMATMAKLKDPKIVFLTNDKQENEKQQIKSILAQTHTQNIIFIEPQLYTYLRNIRLQIQYLAKVEAVYPNRLNPKSMIIWKEPRQREQVKTNNYRMMKQLIHFVKDPTNPNKAFKTKILREIIYKSSTRKDIWKGIIKESKNFRITQPDVEANYLKNYRYEF